MLDVAVQIGSATSQNGALCEVLEQIKSVRLNRLQLVRQSRSRRYFELDFLSPFDLSLADAFSGAALLFFRRTW